MLGTKYGKVLGVKAALGARNTAEISVFTVKYIQRFHQFHIWDFESKFLNSKAILLNFLVTHRVPVIEFDLFNF